MVHLSRAYAPPILKGVTLHKDNPFVFDFIVDTGEDYLQGDALNAEGRKLINYFLSSLAIPEQDLWVNLSPYEKDRTVPEVLGKTEMGRDLLAQDYMLKQVTASLLYPDSSLGKEFWSKIYAQARQMYGDVEVPITTFSRVWIMADQAQIVEHNQTAVVAKCHFKVLLEEDYLAEVKKQAPAKVSRKVKEAQDIIRTLVIPALEKEVNTGRNFAQLRQITYSLILASWYKSRLKGAILNQVYADKKKVNGITLRDPAIGQKIYERYLQAYKKGVFNFIKEENSMDKMVPRKYFSGGWKPGAAVNPEVVRKPGDPREYVGNGRLATMRAGFRPIGDAAMLAYSNIHLVLLEENGGHTLAVYVDVTRSHTIEFHNVQVTDGLEKAIQNFNDEITKNLGEPIQHTVEDAIESTLQAARIQGSIAKQITEWVFEALKDEGVKKDVEAYYRRIGGKPRELASTFVYKPEDRAMASRVNGIEWHSEFMDRIRVLPQSQGKLDAARFNEAVGFYNRRPELVTPDLLKAVANVVKKGMISSLRAQDGPFSAGLIAHHADPAMISPGGIDLSTAKAALALQKDGEGVQMNVDQAMLDRIQRQGVDGFVPVIMDVTPMFSVWPLIGMQESQASAV